MKKRKACGVLLFRSEPEFSFLLMKHPKRWDLPKGHLDKGETELECALREMWEETGIAPEDVQLAETFRFTTVYYPRYKRLDKQQIEKTLVMFLGHLNCPIEIQLTEHKGFEWFSWKPPHQIQELTIDPLLKETAEYFETQGVPGNWNPSST